MLGNQTSVGVGKVEESSQSLCMLCFEGREFTERWYIGGEKNIGFEESSENLF